MATSRLSTAAICNTTAEATSCAERIIEMLNGMSRSRLSKKQAQAVDWSIKQSAYLKKILSELNEAA